MVNFPKNSKVLTESEKIELFTESELQELGVLEIEIK